MKMLISAMMSTLYLMTMNKYTVQTEQLNTHVITCTVNDVVYFGTIIKYILLMYEYSNLVPQIYMAFNTDISI